MAPETNIHEVLHWGSTAEASVDCVVLRGNSEKVINHRSDMTYAVTRGSVHIQMKENSYPLEAGEEKKIPAGHEYQISGDAVMWVTAEPPFDQKSVEVLENF